MPPKQYIPRYKMESHSPHGIVVRHLMNETGSTHDVQKPHRDDHYLFFFQEKGNNRIIVDFKPIRAKGRKLMCVLPGQVHQVTKFAAADGWYIAISTDLVPTQVRTLLEHSIHPLLPADVSDHWAIKLKAALTLLLQHCEDPAFPEDPFQITKSLSDAVLAMFAMIYKQQENPAASGDGRATVLTREFRKLLQKNYRTAKTPAVYAAMLNVSPSYLNEVVRKTTGLPVSQWIQQEIMLEAKRMLYYTDTTVKEIAFDLGYEDHAYFTRMFGKVNGMSPVLFRQNSRARIGL